MSQRRKAKNPRMAGFYDRREAMLLLRMRASARRCGCVPLQEKAPGKMVGCPDRGFLRATKNPLAAGLCFLTGQLTA
ncbi:hypothetical protein, partial [Paraburkholderia bannensis]|uniref:hypothetical protein n=1 Tax=Paraburkholderia bannensis TaxID=765414 RepID=UPI002ABD7CB2